MCERERVCVYVWVGGGSSPGGSLLGGFGLVGFVMYVCIYVSRYLLSGLFCSVLVCSVLFCCQVSTYVRTLIVHIEEMMDRLELLADTVCQQR